MDALFGLPRKKSSGSSYRNSIHGHYFFCDQSAVDEFVSMASSRKKSDMKVRCLSRFFFGITVALFLRCVVTSLLGMC